MTFEELIARWRLERHPSTSELIERIGERIRVELPPLPKKPKSEAARAWMSAVREEPPSHLTARLAQLERFAAETTGRMVWPVVEALEELPADPRLASFAVRCLVRDVRLDLTTKLIRRLINCVEHHGDRSHFELLETHEVPFRNDAVGERLERVIAKGLATKPAGAPFSEKELNALLVQDWKPGEVKPREDPLLAVYAAPWDLGRRQVLADVLLEQGDPRGEFISLQLQRTGDKRQRQLLRKYGDAWLGRLAGAAVEPVFEDGFVSELSVNPSLKQNQYLLLMDAPEWATVRRVRSGLQRLSAQMRDLRDAGAIDAGVLMQWEKEGFALPMLERVALGGDPGLVARVLAELPTKLRHVSMRFWSYGATRELRNGLGELLQAPGLESVSLEAHSDDVVPRLLRELTLDWLPTTLRTLELRGQHGRRLVLQRPPLPAERGEGRGEGPLWHLSLLDPRRPHSVRDWRDLLFALKNAELATLDVTFTSDAERVELDEWRDRLRELTDVTPTFTFDAAIWRGAAIRG